MNPWIIAGPSLGLYVAGWLVTDRIVFNKINEFPDMADMDGVVALLLALFWPAIAVFIGPWWFVTASLRREVRRAKGKARTAQLEYEIYGRKGLG